MKIDTVADTPLCGSKELLLRAFWLVNLTFGTLFWHRIKAIYYQWDNINVIRLQ
jgi:hypothetical protein